MADIKSLSKSDLVSILGLIEYARRCRSNESFRELLMRIKDLLDADYAICGSAAVKGVEVKGLVSAVNGNLPDAWLNHYAMEEFCAEDPILNYHARYSRPEIWSEALKAVDTVESRQVYNHATDFGLKHGVAVGIYVPERQELCVCSFSSGKDVFRERQKNVLDVLSLHLNSAYSRSLEVIVRPADEKAGEMETTSDRLLS